MSEKERPTSAQDLSEAFGEPYRRVMQTAVDAQQRNMQLAQGWVEGLTGVKGPHLQQYEKAKAGARHIHYGRVFMVGKTRATGGFRMWRLTAEEQLVDDGPFEVQRMRHS